MSTPNCIRVLAACFLVATAGAASESALAPHWTLQFKSPIEWQRITPLGHLIVSTSSGLHGIEPSNGEIAWSHTDFGALPENAFRTLPRSSFVVVTDDATPRRVVILDSMDGNVVFDSKAAGIREVVGTDILPRADGLLVFGVPFEGKDPVMSLYDIATGERRWANDSVFARPEPIVTRDQRPKGKFFKFIEKVVETAATDSTAVAEQPAPRIDSEPIELGSGAFLLASNRGLFRIDAKSGAVTWKVSMFLLGRSRVFLSSDHPDLVVVGHTYTHSVNETTTEESVYRAYRASDGEPLWSEPVRLDGRVNDVVFHESGLVLSPNTQAKARVKYVDIATGASMWGKKGKGVKITGGIVDHVVVGRSIVLTTGHDSAWTNKGTEYFLNILDVETGVLRFKAPHKVKGRMLTTEVLSRGILYVTTSEMNVLDPATGKLLHRSVVSKDSLITADAGSRVYAFSSSEGALYVLDKADASLRRISGEAVKLGDGEVPFSLEIDEGQITLASHQNILAYALDGTLKFHAYHPAPRRSGLMRALLMANAVRAGMASAASGVYGAAFADVAVNQEPGSAGNTLAAGLAEGYGEMAVGYGSVSKSYAAAARERFKASAESAEFVFMMVRLDRKGYGLAQVSKKDGSIVSKIDMQKDRAPSYEVDGISNRIYYRLQPTELVGYAFSDDPTITIGSNAIAAGNERSAAP